MKKIPIMLLLILGLAGCRSEGERLQRLEKQFLRACPPQAVYEVIADVDTLRLPLPQSPARHAELARLAGVYKLKLARIDTAGLRPLQLQHWRFFFGLLDSLSIGRRHPSQPERYVLDELFRHFIGRDEAVRHPALLTALVEAVPDYYARVEADWVPGADKRAAWRAAERSMEVLNLLNILESQLDLYSIGYTERMRRALPEAGRAVKNFAGLCTSQSI